MELTHKSVNHKKGEFVGFTDKTAYTNTVENMWRNLKWKVTSFRHNGALDHNIAEYLYRRTSFKKNAMDDGPNFHRFLRDIAAVYPGLGREGMKLFEMIPDELQQPDVMEDDDEDDIRADLDDIPQETADDESEPKIPADADKVIQQRLRKFDKPGAPVCTIAGYQLYPQDLRRLLPQPANAPDTDSWIDDSIINAYGQLIATANPGVVILPEVVSRRLESAAMPIDTVYEQAFVDAGRRNLLNDRLVLVPVNIGGNHWTLVAMDNEARSFSFYNSLQASGRDVLERFRSFVQFTASRFPTTGKPPDVRSYRMFSRISDIPRQTNGVFVLVYADCLARKVNMTFKPTDMPAYRKRILYELLTKKYISRS